MQQLLERGEWREAFSPPPPSQKTSPSAVRDDARMGEMEICKREFKKRDERRQKRPEQGAKGAIVFLFGFCLSVRGDGWVGGWGSCPLQHPIDDV